MRDARFQAAVTRAVTLAGLFRLKADICAFYKQYLSNVGRTAKVGKPSDDDLSIWKRLREIHHALVDMLRPGSTGRELFEAATRLHAERDIPFPFAHAGHGIGLTVHERPMIAPFEDIPYEVGMVSTVETRVRWINKVGYHIEDLIQITEDGPVVLSTAFDNEELLVI